MSPATASRMASQAYRTPVEILERVPGLTATGAAVSEWRPAGRLWVRIDQVDRDGTDETVADRGAKAGLSLTLITRWFSDWENTLSPSRRLQLEGRAFDLRSVVETPGQGTERLLQLRVEAVVR